MSTESEPRLDAVNAGMLLPAAQRIVERYHRDGRVNIHTASGWIAVFWALFLWFAFLVVNLATTRQVASPRGFGVAIFAPFLLLFGFMAIRLVLPWRRVVIDGDGLVVLGHRLPWQAIEWFATDAYVTRSRTPFVAVQVGQAAAAGWRGPWWSGLTRQGTVRRRPGVIALPYRLATSPDALAAALQTILAEIRDGVPDVNSLR